MRSTRSPARSSTRPWSATLGLDPSRPVVAICLTAHRSIPAVRLLRNRGFDAAQLAGGMRAWRARISPKRGERGPATPVCLMARPRRARMMLGFRTPQHTRFGRRGRGDSQSRGGGVEANSQGGSESLRKTQICRPRTPLRVSVRFRPLPFVPSSSTQQMAPEWRCDCSRPQSCPDQRLFCCLSRRRRASFREGRLITPTGSGTSARRPCSRRFLICHRPSARLLRSRKFHPRA
jgi:hypothetical protein